MNLFIRLTLNGAVKQNGNTSQFIFTPEEQIEYASNILSVETGDIFVCGTCGGVGQGTHTFINAGDVMETEVEGLGKMRNKFVAEKALMRDCTESAGEPRSDLPLRRRKARK